MTEQEILQLLKNYLINDCVGIIDKKTKITLKNGIPKNKIKIYVHDIIPQLQKYNTRTIETLLHQAIDDLIKNGNMIDDIYSFYHKFNE